MIMHTDGVASLTVTLQQSQYVFNEAENPQDVMVCVDLMETFLNREVDILLTLRQGSALSKCSHLLSDLLLPITCP